MRSPSCEEHGAGTVNFLSQRHQVHMRSSIDPDCINRWSFDQKVPAALNKRTLFVEYCYDREPFAASAV
jgi:hypothetical protein